MSKLKTLILAIRPVIVTYLVYILSIYLLNLNFRKNIVSLEDGYFIITLGGSVLLLPALCFIMYPRNNKYKYFYFFLAGTIEYLLIMLSLNVSIYIINETSGEELFLSMSIFSGTLVSCCLTTSIGLIIGICNIIKKYTRK